MTRLILGAAAVCTGLMAGIFFAFSVAVMPGLKAGDDRTFVLAMRQINAAIQNGLFGLVFAGALLFTGAAAVMLLIQGRRNAAAWTAAACVLYLVVLILTMGVEVPLNDKLARANLHDLDSVRRQFARTWIPVNHWRTVLTTAALVCLIPAFGTQPVPATVAAWTP